MLTIDTFINLVIVFLMVVIFGYLLGLSVTNTVDRRLSDISINMPKINLPKQDIYLTLGSDQSPYNYHKLNSVQVHNTFNSGRNDGPSYDLKSPNPQQKPLRNQNFYEGFENPTLTKEDDSDLVRNKILPITKSVYKKDFAHPKEPTVPVKAEEIKSFRASEINSKQDIQPTTIDQEAQEKSSEKFAACIQQAQPMIGCETDADCNVVFGQGKNKCLSNHKCYCVEGSGAFCHYGPTYYRDPKDMTARQVQKFKLNAKFDKMTLQDYVNWLMLFSEDLDQLAPRNLNNFIKLKKGIKITLNDIPRDKIPPPMNAEDYFTQLYMLDDQVNIYAPQVSDTAGIQIPANYSNYSSFAAPQNLKHLVSRANTLDQELTKDNHKGILQSVQSKISHDWESATGTDYEEPINGQQPINQGSEAIAQKIKSQVSNSRWNNAQN